MTTDQIKWGGSALFNHSLGRIFYSAILRLDAHMGYQISEVVQITEVVTLSLLFQGVPP